MVIDFSLKVSLYTSHNYDYAALKSRLIYHDYKTSNRSTHPFAPDDASLPKLVPGR